jgi:hypothetical protein
MSVGDAVMASLVLGKRSSIFLIPFLLAFCDPFLASLIIKACPFLHKRTVLTLPTASSLILPSLCLGVFEY